MASKQEQEQEETERAPVWREWRCSCGAFLVEFDAQKPTHLRRKCPKCGRINTLDHDVENRGLTI